MTEYKVEIVTKYKVEMVIEVIGRHPRKWITETIAEQLYDGEDILECNIVKIDDD